MLKSLVRDFHSGRNNVLKLPKSSSRYFPREDQSLRDVTGCKSSINILFVEALTEEMASNASFFTGIKCRLLQRRRVTFTLPPRLVAAAEVSSSPGKTKKVCPPAYNSTCRIRQTSCTYTMPTKRKPGQPRQDSRFKAVFYSCPLLDDCTI